MRLAFIVVAGCSFQPGQLSGPTIDAGPASGDADPDAAVAQAPPRDCLDALGRGVTVDGLVEIDPDGDTGNAPYTAYCNMTTDGGGWTLVYVYGFANYASFDAGSNAATPRPSWTLTTTEQTLVPISTTIPTSPMEPGALPFDRWNELGTTMLASSDINHWLRCVKPASGAGDITVAGATGNMTCSIVMQVATACTTTAPAYLSWFNRGPTLLLTSTGFPHYYYWEASTAGSWPTHDPCGTNQLNHVTGLASPRGAIWLRRS